MLNISPLAVHLTSSQ